MAVIRSAIWWRRCCGGSGRRQQIEGFSPGGRTEVRKDFRGASEVRDGSSRSKDQDVVDQFEVLKVMGDDEDTGARVCKLA